MLVNKKRGYKTATKKDIVNIFEFPIHKEWFRQGLSTEELFTSKNSKIEFMSDTGIFVVFPEAWNSLLIMYEKMKQPSLWGCFSLTYVIKKHLLFESRELKKLTKRRYLFSLPCGLCELQKEIKATNACARCKVLEAAFKSEGIDLSNPKFKKIKGEERFLELLNEDGEKYLISDLFITGKGKDKLSKRMRVYKREKGLDPIAIHFEVGTGSSWADIDTPWGLIHHGEGKIVEGLQNLICQKPAKEKRKEIETNIHFFADRIEVKAEKKPEINGKNCIIIEKDESIHLRNNGITLKGPCIIEEGSILHNNVTIISSYIGEDSEIQSFSIIKKSHLENKVNIHTNVEIMNSLIQKQSTIHSSSHIGHSIIMDNTCIFHNSVIPYSLIGRNVTIGSHFSVACTRLRREQKDMISLEDEHFRTPEIVFYTDKSALRTSDFGTIIGDNSHIGIKVTIHPGRRVGRNVLIPKSVEVMNNLPPWSEHHKTSTLVQR